MKNQKPVMMEDTIGQFKENYDSKYVKPEKEPIEKPKPAQKKFGKVSTPERMKLNGRVKPQKDAAIIDVLNYGARVEIIQDFKDDSFYKILFKGKMMYCLKEFIK